MLEVTAAIIHRGNTFLICRRPAGKHCGLLWEFPGGKMEPGETGWDCIRRECLEELELHLDVERELTDITNAGSEKPVHIHFYLCTIEAGIEPVLKEHESCAWITPDRIPEFCFCPTDAMMLQTDPWKEFSGKLTSE